MSKVIEGLSPDAALSHLENLVMDLNKIVPEPSRDLLTRPLAIKVLEAVIEWMRPITDLDLGSLRTGERVVADHGALALLVELVDALKDLDTPKTHDALRPVPIGAPRKLRRAQQKQQQALVNTVLIVQRAEKITQRKQAESKVARKMHEHGIESAGGRASQKGLENLATRLKNQKKQ